VGARRYQSVSSMDAEQRKIVVRDIFSTVHRTYDLANRVLSFRRDLAWRRFALQRMRFGPRGRFLDVATGTADLAIMAAQAYPGIEAEGIDIAEPMLEIGRVKVERGGLTGRIRLACADALALPFPDASFDVAAIAFGMRNIPDMGRALAEMSRVTVPGGQVMVLEMSAELVPAFRAAYLFYLRRILPGLGKLIAGDASAYHYLAESIAKHPGPSAFADIMRSAGLVEVEIHRLTWGAAYLHVGTVAPRGTIRGNGRIHGTLAGT
jgi:demethylmenaquinone methyltransferase / 2-methoxy-6-polyprenyl-1,4-benzoquinol methylase